MPPHFQVKNISRIAKESNKPPAVVAGAFQTGVLGVRNLVKHGVNALSFDCNPDLQGFRSIYGPSLLCPDPDKDTDGWLEFMRDLSNKLEIRAVLIPSSDRYVMAIAKNRAFLEEYYQVCPGIDLQGQLALKQTQYHLAWECGMPMPTTRMVNTIEELDAFCSEASFPCLLKPRHFREWERLPKGHPLLFNKVSVAENRRDLLESYESVREVSPNVVVQEVILGPDTNKRVYLACHNKQGDRIGHAMFRELRCVPIGFGPASVSEPVEDKEADSICNEFLQKLGYVGICEIEVKKDDRDGKIKLIEVNPRLSGGGDAAPHAGVNLVWLHYRDMIGEHVEPVYPSGRRFQHIVLREEANAVPCYMKAGLLSWKALFQSYKPPLAFFDLDIRDWKVSLETIVIFLRTLIVNIFKSRQS